MADDDLAELRREHALHGGLNIVDAVVNDAVHTQLDLGPLGAVARGVVRADVEADDDSVARGGEHDVRLVDRADAGMDDAHADFLVGELFERGLDGLGAALHIRLDDDVEVLEIALLDAGEQILERDLLARARGSGAALRGKALFGESARHALVGDGVEYIARGRYLGHAGDLHRDGGTGLGDTLAAVVRHHTHAADGGTGNDDVTGAERAVLHKNGHDRAAALVETRFHDRAARRPVRVGLELHDLGLQHEIFEQLRDACAGLCGDRTDDRVAAPLFGDEVVFGEILLDAVGVRAGEVHFVDRHDDRRPGGLGMVDGLDRLRHDAVIGRDDENGDIGHHRAAGAHGGKGLVARGVEEGDGAAVDHHAVRADVLRNAARLARNDIRAADAVEQGGLAVVYVAHDDNDRRARDEFVLGIDVIVDQTVLNRHDDLMLHLAAKLHGDERGGIVIDHVGHGRHHAELDELLDDLDRRFLHAGGELADVDLVGDADLELLLFRDLKLQALHLVALFLAALGACDLLLALLVLVLDLLLAAAADVLVLPGVAGVSGDLVEALVIL